MTHKYLTAYEFELLLDAVVNGSYPDTDRMCNLTGFTFSDEKIYSNMRICDFCFDKADLTYCEFRNCVFHSCTFTGANLDSAYFMDCSFYNCYFNKADLTSIYLIHPTHIANSCVFKDAIINWQSHKLISTLLFKAADQVEGSALPHKLLAMAIENNTGWCWMDWTNRNQSIWQMIPVEIMDWALGVLREYIVDGDSHPHQLTDNRDGVPF